MAEKLKLKIPEGFEPRDGCVACNGTGTKTYMINLFDGEIYHERECQCHCLRRVYVGYNFR